MRWYWLFILFFASSLAIADSIPATSVTNLRKAQCVNEAGTAWGPWVDGFPNSATTADMYPVACAAAGSRWGLVQGYTQCGNQALNSTRSCNNAIYSGYTCPTGKNWTLNGSTCTRPDCVAPQVRDQNSGLCVAPACQAGTTSTASRYTGRFSDGKGGAYGVSTSLPSSLCDGTCSGAPTAATSCTAANAAYGTAIQCDYAIMLSGSQCTGGNGSAPTDPVATAPSPPCASGDGVISNAQGKVVCVSDGKNFDQATYPPKENKTTSTQTNSDGSTKTTNTTQVCTGDGACSTTTITTVTPASGGGAGMAGTPGTTATQTDKPSEQQSDFCAKNPNLQICKGDMNKEATQLQIRDELKKQTEGMETITKPTFSDDSAVTNAKHTQASEDDVKAKDDLRKAGADGSFDPTAGSKSAWQQAMEQGFFGGIPASTCSPFTSTIGGRSWTLDICPTASKISEWGAYCAYVLAAFGIFSMLTGSRKEG